MDVEARLQHIIDLRRDAPEHPRQLPPLDLDAFRSGQLFPEILFDQVRERAHIFTPFFDLFCPYFNCILHPSPEQEGYILILAIVWRKKKNTSYFPLYPFTLSFFFIISSCFHPDRLSPPPVPASVEGGG